ncbi:MAG: iron export ABC transporter permease subunit FetB [bacterium]|nr:iron export ABC transporter permease subunit FetB [bacterium]
MSAMDIPLTALALGYGMLLLPLAVILWLKIPILGRLLTATARMTVQLLFVGLYLQVVFDLDKPWLNLLWLMVMITVADISIIRGCGLRVTRFILPLLASLIVSTAVPLGVFVFVILKRPLLLEAHYLIPLGGMILGNCLRADIIGFKTFYSSIKTREKEFRYDLARGASLHEAVRPFIRSACEAALLPTIATMATIGLVSLPGMMTGVILGGAEPMTAIKYQIAIMIAILTGTSITVVAGIFMSVRSSFNAYGLLDHDIFT